MGEFLRGQVSFEVLLLILLVVIIAITMTNLFIQTNDTTNAYLLIRNEFLLQTNVKNEEIILEQIYFVQEDTPTFYIKTIPIIINSNDINLTLIEDKVNKMTNFKNTKIKINAE